MKEQADWNVVCPRMEEWIAYCHQLGFSEEVYCFISTAKFTLVPEIKEVEGEDRTGKQL